LNLHINRVRLFLCTLGAKDIGFIFNDLLVQCLGDMQVLAHRCTKKVPFPSASMGSGVEILLGGGEWCRISSDLESNAALAPECFFRGARPEERSQAKQVPWQPHTVQSDDPT
jgi:hypothetical protein